MMQQIGQKSTKIFSKSEIKIVKDEKNVDLAKYYTGKHYLMSRSIS